MGSVYHGHLALYGICGIAGVNFSEFSPQRLINLWGAIVDVITQSVREFSPELGLVIRELGTFLAQAVANAECETGLKDPRESAWILPQDHGRNGLERFAVSAENYFIRRAVLRGVFDVEGEGSEPFFRSLDTSPCVAPSNQ